MDNDAISDHTQQYGQVISIQNEVRKNYFSGIPNGVRIFRMRMDKPIPLHITVNSHSTYVQKSTSSSSAHERDIEHDNESPAAQIDDDHRDEENDSNDDHEWSNENYTTTENADDTAKRRLLTESYWTGEENAAKRSCNPGTQKADSEWKMITRWKKKSDIVLKSK